MSNQIAHHKNVYSNSYPVLFKLKVSYGSVAGFQVITNGLYKSVPHRAVVNRSQARISLAYFFAPNLEAEVIACPELIKADEREHYKHYTLKEYLAVKRGQLLNTLDHFALQPLLRTLALPLRSSPRIPVATRFAWPQIRLHPQIRYGEENKRITSIASLATNQQTC